MSSKSISSPTIEGSFSPAELVAQAESSSATPAWMVADSPLRLRTKFAFALITALGGMVIGSGADTQALTTIVVAFAAIGFVCVDWQKLFSLPPVVAYAAMALTAIICVADFIQEAELLGRKMIAVAQLLAVAQAILMLQEKSHRLFEQLLVFALLNCVVAAVFNDAFNYAIWFLPLVFAVGLALAFLAADQTVENAKEAAMFRRSRFLGWNNAAALQSLSSVSLRLPWISLFVLIPAVALFAVAFFFALPRRVDAIRSASANAMVGFSGEVQLGQIGRMQISQERAMRVHLTDPEERRPYPLVDGLYLRGRTLEEYVVDEDRDGGGGTWRTMIGIRGSKSASIPSPFNPARPSDLNFYDRVDVDVSLESMRSSAVFAVAPYHYIPGSEDLVHLPLEGVLARRNSAPMVSSKWFARIRYRFGTHAFRNGIQTEWIAERVLLAPPSEQKAEVSDLQMTAIQLDYLDQIAEYPEQRIPSARLIAEEVAAGISLEKRNPVELSRRFEQYLSSSGKYRYTLDLTGAPIAGMDPIEQFLTIDRQGHCQYFASALAMMLRSQDIPARLVVGYHCNEFSDLGQNYTVRQSHAHAWVEALIDHDEIPIGENIYGQTRANKYWLRLDPTPSNSVTASSSPSGAGQIADLAKNFWNDQVVEMSRDRQNEVLSRTPGLVPMTQSYKSWMEGIKDLAIRINAGEVRGMGGGRLFSLQAAVFAIGLCVLLVVTLKWQLPERFRRRWAGRRDDRAPKPSIAFYAETLELLERVGYRRQTGQTPVELTDSVSDPLLRDPVVNLTRWFYELRYGKTPRQTDSNEVPQALALLRDRVQATSEPDPNRRRASSQT